MAGSIKKRGVESWRLTYDAGRDVNGKRLRRTVTVRGSYKDAEKRLTELISQRDQGFDVAPHKLTVDQFLDRWLATHDVSPQSKARYAQLIRRHISPSIGAVLLQSLRPLQIQDCLAQARERVSLSTSKDVLTLLRMALAQAVRWQLLARNPADAVERPRAEERDAMRILLLPEIEAPVAAAEGTEFGPLIELVLSTGLRRGEALALKWSGVDLEGRTITISGNARFEPGKGVVYGTPKTRRSRRTVALAADTAALLRAHQIRQKEARLRWGPAWMNDDDLVFTNDVGQPIPIGSFNAKFAKLVKKAGIAGRVRFHDLRHTHGTMLASLPSINAKDISDRLGHSDVKFTLNRYVTPTRDRQHEVAEALGSLRKRA